jgi:hypothetical protein
MGHKWMKQFMMFPETASSLLHAYQTADTSSGPVSPRGEPVLHRCDAPGGPWCIWQTFTTAAVDIRLENADVRREIDEHLTLLRSNSVWGVRLDAVAYYSKFLGSQIRHNPGVHEIVDSIAEQVDSHGMRVFAQLDCDAAGQQYFRKDSQANYVVNDFAYAIYLTLALISNDPKPLVSHLLRTANIRPICLRSPRNHDGLLLRSGLLDPIDKVRFLAAVANYGIVPRIIGETPYELNCSGPFLYSLAAGRELVDDLIALSVAITGMTSGWSYFYLPFLLGHVPEDSATTTQEADPRELNRQRVPQSHITEFLHSQRRENLRELLALLSVIHGERNLCSHWESPSASVEGDRILSLLAPGGRYRLLANFDNDRSWTLQGSLTGSLVLGNRLDGNALAPWGFGIWNVQ